MREKSVWQTFHYHESRKNSVYGTLRLRRSLFGDIIFLYRSANPVELFYVIESLSYYIKKVDSQTIHLHTLSKHKLIHTYMIKYKHLKRICRRVRVDTLLYFLSFNTLIPYHIILMLSTVLQYFFNFFTYCFSENVAHAVPLQSHAPLPLISILFA